MPTLILGDIHGSTFWKTAVAENPDCRYIFLGDYLDPYRPIGQRDLLQNFYMKSVLQETVATSMRSKICSPKYRLLNL
jgi:hypothetical protein